MEYREIVPADCAELAKIYADAFNAEPWFEKWSVKTAGKRLSVMIGNGGFFGLAAVLDGEIAGLIMGDEKQYYDGVVFTVNEFCVKNELRGKGIGTALFGEFEKRIKAKGIRAIELCTIPEDEAFYEKLGFEVGGAIMMGKEL